MKKQLSYRHRLVCALPHSLLLFLIDYKCLSEYLDNVSQEHSESFLRDVEKQSAFLEQCYPEVFFTAAFVWRNSPQGHDYWYRRRLWYVQELKQQN